MNPAFIKVISASPADRRDIFLGTSRRLGTTLDNVEKDFWVCWTLDALFNGLPPGGPRLLFKGGTSLSKAFGLIFRFSEDVDIAVFRDDLGQPASITDLESLSRRRRQARLDNIKAACSDFIHVHLKADLGQVLEQVMSETGSPTSGGQVSLDEADADRQSLVLTYPSVSTEPASYIRRAVKIEAGARSALDPHRAVAVSPYIAGELSQLDLSVRNVTTIIPERTFWDKLIILHGQRRWFESRGSLRHDGQRVSRHYYDVHQLANSTVGRAAMNDHQLAIDCARHAKMFFNRPPLDLETALPGTLALSPTPGMVESLRRDYVRMAGMIIGEVPPFEEVLLSVSELEARVNR
jgi:hypothetical protein